ncbi:MAG: hypothetical protein C0501_23395 [Isosphaera sp.]|nr:hypothetical protein [Isosphaera sp.]
MATQSGWVLLAGAVLVVGSPGWAAADPDGAKVRALERGAAEAEVRLGEAKVAAARADLDRARELHGGKVGAVVPRSVVTAAEVALLAAERDLAVARFALARVGATDAKPDPRIDALRKERLTALRKVTDFARERFNRGHITLVDFHRAALEQLAAELDLAGSPADRVAVRERVVKEAKEVERLLAKQFEQGAVAEPDLLRAKAFRLEAEIGLELERSAGPAGGDKPAEKPKWEGSVRVAGDKTKAELAALAKVSLADAAKVAVAAVPGDGAKTAVEVELEALHGYLVYEVEVVVPGRAGGFEVIVDAGTGKVLAVRTDPAGEGEKNPR